MISKKIEVAFVLFAVGIIAWLVYLNLEILESGRVERLVREHNMAFALQEQASRQTQKREDVIIEKIAQGIKNQVRCTINDCLTPGTFESNEPYGIATIYGYHSTTKQIMSSKVLMCDSLTVTSGSSKLTDFFAEAADQRNGYSKDNDGQMVVAIDYSTLDEAKKKLLLNSDKDTPLEILALKKTSDGGVGIDGCYSPMSVLDAWAEEEKEEMMGGDGGGMGG